LQIDLSGRIYDSRLINLTPPTPSKLSSEGEQDPVFCRGMAGHALHLVEIDHSIPRGIQTRIGFSPRLAHA
jgi:hypothetical protein